MDDLNRFVIPVTFVLFVFAALVYPVVRSGLRTGSTGVTFHRTRAPWQRFVGALLGLFHTALTVFVVAIAALGSERVGVARAPTAVTTIGWTCMFAGVALVVFAQANMGRSWRIGIDDGPTALVTHGIYRMIRNPIFTGMGMTIVGLALAAPSIFTCAIALGTGVALTLQVRLEERHLLTLHGEAFAQWAARTGRFVPGFGRIRTG